MAIQYGNPQFVLGVRPIPQILNLPSKARVRLRMRPDDFAKVYVRTPTKLGHIVSVHLIEEKQVGFVLGPCLGTNMDLLDKRRKQSHCACGWRGMAGGEGCILPAHHEGPHKFRDGSGGQSSKSPLE